MFISHRPENGSETPQESDLPVDFIIRYLDFYRFVVFLSDFLRLDLTEHILSCFHSTISTSTFPHFDD